MRNPRLLAGLLLVGAAVAATALPLRASAEGETKAADAVEPLVEHVLTQLVRTKKGLRLGMRVSEARKALAGSAHSTGTHVLALEATPYAFGGAKGTVLVYNLPKEGSEVIDELLVSLLCGEFDRKSVGAKVISVGRSLGYDIERDDEEDELYWGSNEEGATLWVSLAGKGVILIDADVD